MPQNVIDELNLTFALTTTLQLADGTETELQTYEGIVVWDGIEQRVQVIATQGFILGGLALLRNRELNVVFIDGGSVSIEPLS